MNEFFEMRNLMLAGDRDGEHSRRLSGRGGGGGGGGMDGPSERVGGKIVRRVIIDLKYTPCTLYAYDANED